MCDSDTSPANSSSEIWPPIGHRAYYKVTERLDGQPEVRFDLTLPGKFSKFDLSTAVVGRHGGPNAEDLQFRAELYQRIGAIVVAAGHVEMAMKRLLLVLTSPPEASFSTVDVTWTDLHKQLCRQCDGSDSRRRVLADVLKWAEEQGLKRRRDNVIHASWWDFAGCGVRRSRFTRGSDGQTISSSLGDLEEDAGLLFAYAEQLNHLLGPDWMIARLPGPFTLNPDAAPLSIPTEVK